VALQLRAKGIRRVRPLLGGYNAWKEKGFPLVKVDFGQDAVVAV
jgi:rhodanese-related sulfurtransferase